jgi:protein-tyrosine sulfotransferase
MADSSELREHPIFICGHPKSGTSLLRSIFDSHPQLVVFPEETVFFRRYLPRAAGLDPEGMLALADQLLIHIFRWNAAHPVPDQEDFPGRDYSTISFDEVHQVMRQLVDQQYRNPGDILSAAVLAFGQVSGQIGPLSRGWVEKSPYNEYFADQIFGWWSAARCIHILRDPRDNYVSYRRKHPDWTPEFFAASWNRSTRAGMQNQERFGMARYLILRYEDLVLSPEKELEKLMVFLQIEWDPALISPTRAGSQWGGNSMFASQFQEISAKPVGRWKDRLAQDDAIVIEIGARKWIKVCGYHSEAAIEAGFSNRLTARWRLITWQFRRRLIKRPQTAA